MRKLSWLLIAIALAFYATHLWSTADPTATYVVRDGLLVALLALFLVARFAGPATVAVATPRLRERLTTTGSLFLGVGASCALVGGLLPNIASTTIALNTALILRGLGLLALILAVIGPRTWRLQLAGDAGSAATDRQSAGGRPWLPLIFVTLIGLGVRLLIGSRLPATCVGGECDAALTLATSALTPATFLPQLFARVGMASLLSVRLATATLALLLLPLFYWVARQLTNNGTALVGTLLLTLSPWFYTLDGGALPQLSLLLASCMGIGLLLLALDGAAPRWALLSGVLLGSTGWGDPLIAGALLGWLLLLLAPTVGVPRNRRQLLPVALALIGGIVMIVPVLLAPKDGLASLTTAAANGMDGATWLFVLFQEGLLSSTQWTGIPPLTMPLGALTVAGLGLYLRRLRTLRYFWLASGLLIFALLFLLTGSVTALSLLFLLAVITATLTIGALLEPIRAEWAPLFSFANAIAIASLVVLLLSGRTLVQQLGQEQVARAQEDLIADQRMIEAIAELAASAPDQAIFAPAALLQNPAARLRLGDTTLARIQPLTDLLTTIYTTDTPRTTTYFIPATAQPYTDLLQRLQPTSLVDQQLDPVSGQLLFSQLTVSAADLRARQGLLGVAWDGSGNATELTTAAAGALVVPGATVPITAPYTVQWSGALRVAMPGTYGFMLTAANGAMPTTGLITLQLDNQLIIDSSLGLLNQEVPLVKGFYQLTLQYQVAEGDENDELAQYAVHWQRPDGVDEVIPQQQLSNLPLPNIGLIGEYYWGDAPSGAPFEIRKDLVVGYVPDRQEPYVIRWRGQIGAGRGGEYLFAALSAPGSATQITIDGVQLADSTLANAGADDARATSPTRTSAYAEGVMYLNRGWHAIEIIHRPDATHAPVQLFWQPPGSGPAPVDAAYLAPTLTPLSTADRGLPLAPPLANGDSSDRFALSTGTEFWQPQRRVPPSNLPLLPLEAIWQVGSCGAALAQFNQPHGVALSGIRNLLYVADTANRRVVEYTLDGVATQSYTSAEWQEPVAVALIDEGFPVVLDATTQLIYDLNHATGAVTTRPLATGFYHPRGLAVESSGNLLIADTGGARVVQLSPAGDVLRTIGGPDTQLGRGQPTTVAGHGGLLWSVTAEDGRLWQVDSGGSYTAIEPTNTLNGPHLAALPTGPLLLTDPARRRLLYLAATGEPLAEWPLSTMATPTGVAVTTIDDLLYVAVADSGSCQLALWRTPLTTLPR